MTSSRLAESVPLRSDRPDISFIAAVSFSSDLPVMIMWYDGEEQARTLDAAKPMPELAPASSVK